MWISWSGLASISIPSHVISIVSVDGWAVVETVVVTHLVHGTVVRTGVAPQPTDSSAGSYLSPWALLPSVPPVVVLDVLVLLAVAINDESFDAKIDSNHVVVWWQLLDVLLYQQHTCNVSASDFRDDFQEIFADGVFVLFDQVLLCFKRTEFFEAIFSPSPSSPPLKGW